MNEQIISYIGNKRRLLSFIGKGIERVISRTGKSKLDVFDAFSGSGVVSRFLKRYSNRLITNDLETYSYTINKCYLSNKSEVPFPRLKEQHREMLSKLESGDLKSGWLSNLYAPTNDKQIKEGERVYYTKRNARYIYTARCLIEAIDPDLQHFFLAPLLAEASVHVNTSGVFKGFYKDSTTGIGKYGGTNGDALSRILGDIHLPFPEFSYFECAIEVHKGDTNEIAKGIRNLDVTYIDPPYNQHPYGSNYFMLNLIAENKHPHPISEISGIPVDWNRSEYNSRKKALQVIEELIQCLDSNFLLISFNSEGFIGRGEMMKILRRYGSISVLETSYNTFRGSRNLRNRDTYVTEYLYLLEKAG